MTDKQTPRERQEAIKELLQKERLSDQKQIVTLLKKEYGIETNQAVVSRDLRRLRVVKKEMNQVMVYTLPTTDVVTEILKLAIVDIEHNEVMVVIKTHPGLADFVGDCLDQHADLDIIGSLAGENVVFVTPRSIKRIVETYQSICMMLHFKPEESAHV